MCIVMILFFKAEDGIRYLVRSRGLGDVYKRQAASGRWAGAAAVDFALNDFSIAEEPLMNPGALAGIRVVDLSRVLAGPFCTMLLADYGAEVVKVEQPGHGDPTRAWGPPWVGEGSAAEPQSAYYLTANRNKRGMTLDLKSEAGLAVARRLIATADGVGGNFRPGQLARALSLIHI